MRAENKLLAEVRAGQRTLDELSEFLCLDHDLVRSVAEKLCLQGDIIGRQAHGVWRYSATHGYWVHPGDPSGTIGDPFVPKLDADEVGPPVDSFNPSHYRSHPSGIECIQIGEHENFNRGNALKYWWRAGLKGDDPVKDYRKAIWYIEREIKRVEGLK